MAKKNDIIKQAAVSTIDTVQHAIVTLRGKQVLLDSQLAQMYGVETKVLNQAVKRNIDRFPEDFMFQLSRAEFASLRSKLLTINQEGWSQIVTNPAQDIKNQYDSDQSVMMQKMLKSKGGRPVLPYAFTEQGVAMLSSVLHSKTAIQVNISIMRAFVAVRHIITESRENTLAIDELRTRMKMLEDAINNSIADTNAQTEELRQELDAIHQALQSFTERPSLHPRRRIGFDEETIE